MKTITLGKVGAKNVTAKVGKYEADGYLFTVSIEGRVVYHGWSRGTKSEALQEARVCAKHLALIPEDQ